MRCANPKCQTSMLDTQGGTMRMLELEMPPEARVAGSEWGFPVQCAPVRYFWLCEECSRVYQIRQWRHEGLLLEPRLTAAERPKVIHVSEPRRPVASQRTSSTAASTRIA